MRSGDWWYNNGSSPYYVRVWPDEFGLTVEQALKRYDEPSAVGRFVKKG